MSRIFPDWLDAYQEYTRETESAGVFNKWVGASMIAGVLRKKAKLSLGRIKVFPNLYVVLVAEPGTARKSTAIKYGKELLEEVPDIYCSADSVTREALLADLESCAVDEQLMDGTTFRHSSMSIISGEFETFLGQKTDNAKMVVLLTDLFDCSEAPWRYRTKGSGTNIIPSVFVNLLGATTPESLASSLPPSAIGGGLTSRILFVWAAKKEKKIPIPDYDEKIQTLGENLKKDLFRISKIQGTYTLSEKAREHWIKWYMQYEELDQNRLARDKAFDGWYSRKPLYILKMAMIVAASQGDSLIIEPHHLIRAIQEIEAVEPDMGRVFRAVGKSAITAEVDMVTEIIRARRVISEKDLMSIVWRDIDKMKFDNVINTALATGQVSREYSAASIKKKYNVTVPSGGAKVWYAATD